MWHRYVLILFVFRVFAAPITPMLRAQTPAAEGKVITIPLDPLAKFKDAGDLLAWVHTGSVKFGGTDPIIRIRVTKEKTAIVPKDYRQRESKLKLTDQEMKELRETLLEDINLPHIAGPWFNGQANLWDGSQDCYLIRGDQKAVTLTCEYGWPSASASRDHAIRRYHRVMQTYVDLMNLVRAGGQEAVARHVPLANAGLKKHLPEAAPLTANDFAFGENFPAGHRRITFVREKEINDGQWEKVRVEVIVPDDAEPHLGDITIDGKRFPMQGSPLTTKATK